MSEGQVVGAIVVAAGTGERFGCPGPKALVEAGGTSLVARAVAALRAAGIDTLVVVHTPGSEAAFVAAVDDPTVILTAGGANRSASVRAGLAVLPAEVTLVAVHDAARAFTPPEVIATTVAAVKGDVLAAAPALPVADTLKTVDGRRVTGTVDRHDLVAVQTPQVFPVQVLRTVVAAAASATDDLALVEQHLADGRLTGRVVWVPGSLRGRKITYPDDLRLAEVLASDRPTGR